MTGSWPGFFTRAPSVFSSSSASSTRSPAVRAIATGSTGIAPLQAALNSLAASSAASILTSLLIFIQSIQHDWDHRLGYGRSLSGSTAHPHGHRPRGAWCVGPALLGQGHGAQADLSCAGDVAEAVTGAKAAAVIAAGDEDGSPKTRLVLVVLNRDQLAAARQGCAAGSYTAP